MVSTLPDPQHPPGLPLESTGRSLWLFPSGGWRAASWDALLGSGIFQLLQQNAPHPRLKQLLTSSPSKTELLHPELIRAFLLELPQEWLEDTKCSHSMGTPEELLWLSTWLSASND